MLRSLRITLVLLGVLAWLATSMVAAQTYDPATRTVTVAPSGADDTLALRTAFDVCQAVGPGCTVQLTAGVFRTLQIEVWGFDGTFAGAGVDATVVETLAPLTISPPDLDVTQRFAEREGGPVLLTFRDPHMRLRDMTVRNSAATATVGWRFGGRRVSALWGLVLLEGTSIRVDVERIAVEAAPGSFEGLSVLHAMWVSGLEEFPGGPVAPMAGNVSIRDSRIRGAFAGVLVSNAEGLTVAIRDSEIDGQEEAVWLGSVGSSMVDVRGNDLTGRGAAVVGMDYRPQGRVAGGPTTLVLTGNVLRAVGGDRRARAFTIIDAAPTASQFALVANNTIELAGGAAVGGAGERLIVRDNRITGRAEHGIVVGGGPAAAFATGWVVVGNDMSELVTSREPIAILPLARGTLVVCELPTEVLDTGVGSIFACD